MSGDKIFPTRNVGDYLKILPMVIRKMLKRVEIERENISLQKERDRYLEAINEELDMAKNIQDSLIPIPPPEITGLRLAARYIPTGKIGGDMFDVLLLDDAHAVFFIYDVSGHGVPAALICSMMKILLRQELERSSSPRTVLNRVNQNYRKILKVDNFVTIFLGVLEIASGRFVYTRGGHSYPLVLPYSQEAIFQLDTSGFALGMMDEPLFEEKEVILKTGDRLLLYTDGIYEVFDRRRQMMGFHEFLAIVNEFRREEIDILLEKLLVKYKAVQFTSINEDDISLLAIEYQGINKK